MLRTLVIMPDGRSLSSGIGQENAIQSMTFTQCVNDGAELTLGSVCANMVQLQLITPAGGLSLNAGDEITVYKVDDTDTRHLLGLFTVEKPTRSSANAMNITAYDRVTWLDKDLSKWLAGLDGWPYGLLEFSKLVCSACGLTLVNEEIPNGNHQVQKFSASGITGRQLIRWAGELAGRFCRANPDGTLEFAWYEPAQISIGAKVKYDSVQDAAVAILEDVPQGERLHAVTQIEAVGTGTDKITLYHRSRNLFNKNSDDNTYKLYYKASLDEFSGGSREYIGVDILDIWHILNKTDKSKKITLSFDLKTDVAGPVTVYTLGGYQIYLGIAAGDTSARIQATAEWQRFTITRTIKTVYNINDPNGDACRLSFYGTYGTGAIPHVKNIQFEISDVETEYVPYAGRDYTLQLPEPVYSGSFDWNTGLLTGDAPLQLEPIALDALEGMNILVSDCGNTSVSYGQEGFYQGSLSFEDYETAPMEKVQLRTTETDVGAVYPDAQEGNTYILSGNFLVDTTSAASMEELAQSIYEQLQGVQYTPCKVTVPAQLSLNAGQTVSITDANGKTVTAYIMKRTMAGQRDTLECTGSHRRDSTTAVNNSTYKVLSGRVLELSKNVEGLHLKNADVDGRMAALSVTVEGIGTQVEKQQSDVEGALSRVTAMEQTAEDVSIQVKSIQENGVSKVETATGYTFGEDGLHIRKTGEEMENRMDHTGMYVERSGEVILQANNQGVQATDVTVRNYLVVGEHARFEDYGEGRTACFWLGG